MEISTPPARLSEATLSVEADLALDPAAFMPLRVIAWLSIVAGALSLLIAGVLSLIILAVGH